MIAPPAGSRSTPGGLGDELTARGLPRLPAFATAPHFAVRLHPPDLSPWMEGNAGLRGVMQFTASVAGPNVVITALMHGNEFAGAIVLDQLLRAGFRPRRGRLSIGFLNLDAFARFDASQPTTSRFVDEDMNRIWDRSILQGRRESLELTRARELQPLFDQADIVMDLHSMLWPSDPLILSGATDKGRRFAVTLGTPSMVVTDQGHTSGPRLIDYHPFADPLDPRVACLIEAGPHWEPDSVEITRLAVQTLLHQTGMTEHAPVQSAPRPPPRCAAVTQVVTVTTGKFSFTQPFRGGEVIAQRDTLIGHDGPKEIRTPYDDCLLVMPSLRPIRGHTAVRLARLLPASRNAP